MRVGSMAVLVPSLALAACSPGLPECGAAPPALTAAAELPSGFPEPGPFTFTAEREAGPSTVVEGYWTGELEEAFEGWRAAFPPAGYDIVKDEIETNDAEVNFAGGGTTGQVRMVQTCAGRVTTSIIIRPA